MFTDLNPDIIRQLYAKGVSFLYAPNQLGEDDPIWVPMIVDIFECDWIDPECDAILVITEALQIPFERFLNHKIILPNNPPLHSV